MAKTSEKSYKRLQFSASWRFTTFIDKEERLSYLFSREGVFMIVPEVDLDLATLRELPRKKLLKTRKILRDVLDQDRRIRLKAHWIGSGTQEQIERFARLVKDTGECIRALGGRGVIKMKMREINAILEGRL